MIINIVRVFSEFLFVDPRKIRSYNERIRRWLQKTRQAIRERDFKLLRRLKREKKVIDTLRTEMFKMRYKPIMILFAVSIPLFYALVYPYMSPKYSVEVPALNLWVHPLVYFFIISIAVSSIFTIILKYGGYA